MNFTKSMLAAACLYNLTTASANAALTLNTFDGQNLVYSSISDITWTGDANLLATLQSTQGYNTIVNSIIAASPIINDTPNGWDTPPGSGYYMISASDFDSTNLGRVTWWGAKAFANYLNNINYAGFDHWALPTSIPLTFSQFDQLFYSELGGTIGNSMPITNYFTNVKAHEPFDTYWSASEWDPASPSEAMKFSTFYGWEVPTGKVDMGYAWAVNVTTVPVPGAIWLFGTGIIALLRLKALRKIGFDG